MYDFDCNIMKIIFCIFLNLITYSKDIIFMSPVSFAPWVVQTKEGKVEGIMYEMSKDLSLKISKPVEFKYLPIKRFLRELNSSNDFDITLYTTHKNETLKNFIKVFPAVNVNNYYIYFSNKFKSCKEIKTLSTAINTPLNPLVYEKCNSTIQSLLTKTVEQRVKLFLDKKSDSVIIGEQEVMRLDEVMKKEIKKFHFESVSSGESYLYVHKKSSLNSPYFLEKISDYAREIKAKYFTLKN